MYPEAFAKDVEDLQEGHVPRVWAEVMLHETQNFWLFMIYKEARYLLTVLYVAYFQ